MFRGFNTHLVVLYVVLETTHVHVTERFWSLESLLSRLTLVNEAVVRLDHQFGNTWEREFRNLDSILGRLNFKEVEAMDWF